MKLAVLGLALVSGAVWALCSPPTLTFTATPAFVPAGSASTLNWSTTDATSCTATGSWKGLKLATGFSSVAPGTYSLTCVGPAGSVAKSITVTIGAPPPPPPVTPTVTLAATPSSLVSGNQAALTWTSTNTTGCTASGAWSGAKPLSGGEASPALSASSSPFTLTCVGPGGSAAATANVTVTSAPPSPPTGASGWQQIQNSTIRAVCPPNNFGGIDYPYASFCTSVVNAWNSAVFDSKRNRLVVWGGGHNDYYGNEIYALNLNAPQSMQRLNDPSPHLPISACGIVANADGSSKSRHTYDALAYLPAQDKMFVFGGSVACLAGGLTNDTWTFDFATMKWQQMAPSGSIPNAAPGAVTAYDSNSGRLFLHTDWNLYSYDPAANSYTQHANNNAIDYHMTAVVDPVRRKFLVIGGGQAWSYDITAGGTYARTALNMTGALPIRGASYPGLAYHPPTGNVVAWSGGDTVYALAPNGTWTATTYPNGPGPAQANGTFKRWNYSPAAGAFVLVNSVDQNAFLLKL